MNPSVYCSAPHPPQLYGCAFKTKSPVHLGWPQKGLDGERTDPLGNGKPPPCPELGSSEQTSFLLGISVHSLRASWMRNPSSAFKYIWCERVWSLQHHMCHQGEDTAGPGDPHPLCLPQPWGKMVALGQHIANTPEPNPSAGEAHSGLKRKERPSLWYITHHRGPTVLSSHTCPIPRYGAAERPKLMQASSLALQQPGKVQQHQLQ